MRKIEENLEWKNEKKLRELTSDVFPQVKIMLFTQSTFYQYYRSRFIWSKENIHYSASSVHM